MRKILILAFTIAAAVLAGCSAGSYENVTPEKAMELIDNQEVKVLDVRNPDEYNAGHIPGSELVPLQVIDGMSEDLEKDQTYLVVCRSGNRSQQASEILAGKGFKVVNMTGGMMEWTGEIE